MLSAEFSGECLRCGYPLRALAVHRCPECGRSFNPNDDSTYGPLNAPPIAKALRRPPGPILLVLAIVPWLVMGSARILFPPMWLVAWLLFVVSTTTFLCRLLLLGITFAFYPGLRAEGSSGILRWLGVTGLLLAFFVYCH